jgi:hypothetical protein
MTTTVEANGFTPALPSDNHCDGNMGICGAWFVRGSRDWFTSFDDGLHVGYEVSNCCGRFILAIAK